MEGTVYRRRRVEAPYAEPYAQPYTETHVERSYVEPYAWYRSRYNQAFGSIWCL